MYKSLCEMLSVTLRTIGKDFSDFKGRGNPSKSTIIKIVYGARCAFTKDPKIGMLKSKGETYEQIHDTIWAIMNCD